jgi:beta-glucosidase-like glycosyl hydrolase
MIPFRFEKFLEDLLFLVESGEIPVSRIDDAVERILRVKFISGVFEHPFSEPALLDVIGCKVKCIFFDKGHFITFKAKEPGICIVRMHTAVTIQLLQPQSHKKQNCVRIQDRHKV